MQATQTDPPAAMEIRTALHEVSSEWEDFHPIRDGKSVFRLSRDCDFQNSVGLAAAIALIQCGEVTIARAEFRKRVAERWI